MMISPRLHLFLPGVFVLFGAVAAMGNACLACSLVLWDGAGSDAAAAAAGAPAAAGRHQNGADAGCVAGDDDEPAERVTLPVSARVAFAAGALLGGAPLALFARRLATVTRGANRS